MTASLPNYGYQVHICISIRSPWVFGWKGGPSTIVHWKMYTFPNIGHSIVGVAPLPFPMSMMHNVL